jgi:uncharacterized protein
MSEATTPAVTDVEVEAPYTHSTGPALTRFLGALRDDATIWGRRCDRCARTVVPAADHCDSCGAQLGAWTAVGPEGRIEGLTVVERPMPLVGLDPPFAVLRVRLDGADTDLIHLGPVVEGLERGVRVRPRWAAQREGAITDLEGFVPVGDEPLATGAPVVGAEPVTVVTTHLRLPFRYGSGVLASRFADAIRAGEIRGNHCPECELRYLPPRQVCPRCWVPCVGWDPVADHGVVTTFVVVNVPFYGQDIAIPYVLAQILLDGTDQPISHLVAVPGSQDALVAPPGGARIGMRVRAVWREREDRQGFINDDIDRFEPTGEADADAETLADHV